MSSAPPFQVLIIEPESAGGSLLHHQVEAFGHAARYVRTAEESLVWLTTEVMDVVVFRVTRADAAAGREIRDLRARAAGAEVVLVANQNAVAAAAEAVRQGAFALVAEPYRIDALELAILRAGETRRLRLARDGMRALTRGRPAASKLVGSSPPLRRLREDAARVAATDTPVLITGEWGSGKTALAETIHQLGDRSEHPCCVVECAGKTESAVTAELFGHAGEGSHPPGILHAADGGTLVVQNVVALPPTLQTALARLLETGEVVPPHGGPSRRVDVRVIATSAEDQAGSVAAGVFRKELLYRLNALEFHVPPLRERAGDIRELTEYFLAAAPVAGPAEGVHDAVIDLFARYGWPGNVWELRTVVEWAAVRAAGPLITLADVPPLERRELEPSHGDAPRTSLRLAEIELLHIQRVLHLFRGNKTQAARALGITTKTLYNKLNRYARTAAAADPAARP